MDYPHGELFSRQQLHEMTAIPDDVLGYWMKEGLLMPADLPGRKHRRFTFDQLHLASVLNEMRGLGANIGVLRKFSDLVNTGKRLTETSGLNRGQRHTAANLARLLSAFRAGREISVWNEDYDLDSRNPNSDIPSHITPSNEEQIFKGLWHHQEDGPIQPAIDFGKKLTAYHAVSLSAYDDLLINFTPHRGRLFNWTWVAWIDENDHAVVASGEDGNIAWGAPGTETCPSKAAFYITISTCIREIWSRAGRWKPAQMKLDE